MTQWQASAGATLLVPSGPEGKHPFVTQQSYVLYKNMRIDRVADLAARVAQAYFTPREPMPVPILERILAGRLASPHTKREFKELPI